MYSHALYCLVCKIITIDMKIKCVQIDEKIEKKTFCENIERVCCEYNK